MTNSWHDITERVEPGVAATLAEVGEQLEALGVAYFVVGATARDMIMDLVYDAGIQRATRDVDLAVAVRGWRDFQSVQKTLIDIGYRETAEKQRLLSGEDIPVDIVPFGEVADAQGAIAWPPDGEVVMDVRGFQEAYQSAETVKVGQDPRALVLVASPVGLVLLKVIAWIDRGLPDRQKDAQDIKYFLQYYDRVKGVIAALYEDLPEEVMDGFEWDVTLGSAYLLGTRAREIASAESEQAIVQLVNDQVEGSRVEDLVYEMAEGRDDPGRVLDMIRAFFRGFCSAS